MSARDAQPHRNNCGGAYSNAYSESAAARVAVLSNQSENSRNGAEAVLSA